MKLRKEMKVKHNVNNQTVHVIAHDQRLIGNVRSGDDNRETWRSQNARSFVVVVVFTVFSLTCLFLWKTLDSVDSIPT